MIRLIGSPQLGQSSVVSAFAFGASV